MIVFRVVIAGICVATAVLAAAPGAFAFEQTVVPAGKAAKVPAQGLEQSLPGLELTVPSQTGGQTGAGITFPGLGSLGALPKLDFGLELLYGAAESKAPGDLPSELPPDALTVYGSVKKTF
jgi:hypothetical protein